MWPKLNEKNESEEMRWSSKVGKPSVQNVNVIVDHCKCVAFTLGEVGGHLRKGKI